VTAAEQVLVAVMKTKVALQPVEAHSPATVQVLQLAAHLVQAPEDGKYPSLQVVQVVASVQALQLDPQATQPPVVLFLKYPVSHLPAVQVEPVSQAVQLFGHLSQTLVVALLTYPALHLAAVQVVPSVHSEQLEIQALHPVAEL
jgi:hypothetical protein